MLSSDRTKINPPKGDPVERLRRLIASDPEARQAVKVEIFARQMAGDLGVADGLRALLPKKK